jgi:polyisoprenoid-binding protein YceI
MFTKLSAVLFVLLCNIAIFAQQIAPREITFIPNAADSSVSFSLDATLHTVHGTFTLKKSSVHFSPGNNQIEGEIVLDATSAKTGIEGRDDKMHKDVLESARYPEITFRPVRVEGAIAMEGASNIQIHGVFTIHGVAHEMTVPTEVEITPQRWQATSHFAVPYVQWGMKNPSNFFLHVKDSVQIEVKLAGGRP